MQDSLIDEIGKIHEFLPKKQRQLCQYILTNYAQVGVMTVAELADNAGVGTTTVLRLVEHLGFESYNAFKRKLLGDSITKENSAYQAFKSTILRRETAGASSALSDVCAEIVKNCSNFLTPSNLESFEQAVNVMLNAKKINILGMRSSAALALYMECYLRIFRPETEHLSFQQEYLYDKLFHIGTDEVFFAISIWPCTKRTIEAAELCHKRGVPVILLTNTRINPIAKFADIVIDTNSIEQSSAPVSAMVVIQALVQELGRRTTPQSSEALDRLENLLVENHLIVWEKEL